LVGNDYSTSLKTKSLDCLAIVLTDTTVVEHYTTFIISIPQELFNFNSDSFETPRKKQRSNDHFSDENFSR